MEHKVSKIKLSPEAAHHKIKNWCAYQERSQDETRRKLFEYGLFSADVEEIIAKLIEENFLNEERFAIAFASGKFRIKHWGRNKIKAELKKHRVSDYCLNKALKSINADDYRRVIEKLIEKKTGILKPVSQQKQFYSILNYMVSRGFESNLIIERLNKLKIESTF